MNKSFPVWVPRSFDRGTSMCLAGGAARRVRSRALPCSIGGYTKSCAAWGEGGTLPLCHFVLCVFRFSSRKLILLTLLMYDVDIFRIYRRCANCTNGLVGATCGATWGSM